MVSIIILNYNGIDFLTKCLSSLSLSKYSNTEILVVDNGSTDGSQNIVRTKFPYIKLIENNKNMGFGSGNNIGIENSKGEFILFINNDVVLEPDCINLMVEKMIQEENIGIIGAKIYVGNLKETLQYAGGKIDPSGSGILIGYLEKDFGQYDTEKNVDWVHGATFMVRRKVFSDVGFFDPIYYPIYHDEIDLCFRASIFRYEIRYLPPAKAYHFEDITSKKTYKTAFFRIRNTLIFAFKFSSPFKLFLIPWLHVRIMINGLKSPKYRFISKTGTKDLVLAYFKAYLWILSSLPLIMQHRYFSNYKVVINK